MTYCVPAVRSFRRAPSFLVLHLSASFLSSVYTPACDKLHVDTCMIVYYIYIDKYYHGTATDLVLHVLTRLGFGCVSGADSASVYKVLLIFPPRETESIDVDGCIPFS